MPSVDTVDAKPIIVGKLRTANIDETMVKTMDGAEGVMKLKCFLSLHQVT